MLYFLVLISTFLTCSAQTFSLITSLYNETDANRMNELAFCIKKNVEDPKIKHVCVIYDTSKDNPSPQENRLFNFLKTLPISIVTIQDRPTFGQTFELANKLYPDSVVIVANADIFFNKTLK